MLGPHEFVVVELVAPGPRVALETNQMRVFIILTNQRPLSYLVFGHWVGHALVHVDVHLGAQHRHVVTWTESGISIANGEDN